MKPKERTFVVRGQQCRTPKCRRDVTSRGLCASCYQVAYQLVSAEVTTWDELAKRGKCDEPKRTTKAWFLDWTA